MMRRYMMLLLIWCGLINAYGQTYNMPEVRKVVERANYEFSNLLMYKNMGAWVGKMIAFRGTIHAKPVIVAEDREYIEISGSSSGGGDPIDLVAYLDSPLPTPRGIGDTGPSVSRGSIVYVFGTLQKCRDFVDRNGYVRYLPTMECEVIFDRDDREFERPLWSSRPLRR